MTDEEIRDAVKIMRQRASRVGPQHALWDLIIDCEMMLKGLETSVPRPDIEAAVEHELRIS